MDIFIVTGRINHDDYRGIYGIFDTLVKAKAQAHLVGEYVLEADWENISLDFKYCCDFVTVDRHKVNSEDYFKVYTVEVNEKLHTLDVVDHLVNATTPA